MRTDRQPHPLERIRELMALRHLAGPPLVDPVSRALRRALMTGELETHLVPHVATAARYGEIAILAAQAAPLLAPPLAEAIARQRHVDALLELALTRAADTLTASGLDEVALLKGRAAIAWVYPDSAARFRRDIDLLVPHHLVAARAALIRSGWRSNDAPGADPTRDRTASLVLPLGRNAVSIDLHRTLTHTPWCRPDPRAILAARVTGRAPLPVTSPVDTFLHTTLHLVGNGFHEPLKAWLDLIRLLPLVPAAQLSTRAHAFGLATASWTALVTLERWFQLDTRAHQAAVAPSRPRMHLLRYLLAGDHATPERHPLPRAVSWRLWRALVHDPSRGSP